VKRMPAEEQFANTLEMLRDRLKFGHRRGCVGGSWTNQRLTNPEQKRKIIGKFIAVFRKRRKNWGGEGHGRRVSGPGSCTGCD